MSDTNETKIMPEKFPKDLEGIYRLLGYEDKNNYDDKEYKDQYEAALELLKDKLSGN